MSKLSLFTQVGMIIVAVIIFMMYIKPTMASIQTTEQTTASYVAEANKVKEVDDLLATQVAKIDGVKPADVDALKRYMPDTVDDVAVIKDLTAIFASVKIPLVSVSAGGAGAAPGADGDAKTVTTHGFSVSAQMSYEELKKLLHAIEVNDYLLQIESLALSPSENGSVTVSISLTSFSRAIPVASVPVETTSE